MAMGVSVNFWFMTGVLFVQKCDVLPVSAMIGMLCKVRGPTGRVGELTR